jgi:type IV pilus assembly protein PilM
VRSGAVTVVVPDAAARVLLLDFDDTAGQTPQEALSVVRFRLRKMVPFDVEDSSVSYQVMGEQDRTAERAGDGDARRGAGGI